MHPPKTDAEKKSSKSGLFRIVSNLIFSESQTKIIRQFGIRGKLLMLALLMGVLPLIIASILLPSEVESALAKSGNAQLSQRAEDMAQFVQHELSAHVEKVTRLADRDFVIETAIRYNEQRLDTKGLSAINELLKSSFQSYTRHHHCLFLSNPDGLIFAGNIQEGEPPAFTDLKLSSWDYAKLIRNTHKPVISDPMISPNTGIPYIVIAVPILDYRGRLVGILGASISIDQLSQFISSQKWGSTGYMFAIDKHGLLIAHPNKHWVFKLNLKSTPGTAQLQTRMPRGETGIETYISSEGAEKLAAFTPIPAAGWSVAASMETSEFSAPADKLRLIIFVMIGACAILAIVVACSFAVGLEEIKSALAETQRNEVELSVIHNSAPIMMILLDRNCRIRRVNRAARSFASHASEFMPQGKIGDLLGCIRCLDASDGCGFGPECNTCTLRNAEVECAETGHSQSRIETRLRLLRAGEPIDYVLLTSTSRMEIDGEHRILVCIEDITQQKLAEERIHEQAALLEETQEVIMVLDLDSIITFWNRGAEQIYGWTSREAIGRNMFDILHASRNHTDFRELKNTIWEHGNWSGEYKLLDRSGQLRSIRSRVTLVKNAQNEPRGYFVISTDVTEEKLMEAKFLRVQRMESLGELAGGVAHDLNNVLSPILMGVELLRPLASDKKDREILGLLGDSAQRGADIVRQLLLFARGSTAPRTNVNIPSVLEELERIVRSTFPKSITITMHLDPGLHQILADRTQLHQVFLNLFVNARDAMPGGGSLHLDARNEELTEAAAMIQPGARQGPHVCITVSDTGSGIPPAILDKIFDPFFTTKPAGSGTGLGLSTVAGIIRSHGGFITVQSQQGTGTDFLVHLPASGAAHGSQLTDAAAGAVRGNGELILIVDDEVAIQEIIRLNLEEANYKVLPAHCGEEALKLCAEQGDGIHAVISDLVMPGIDGIQTIKKIQQALRDIPVIALSGADDWRDKLEKAELKAITFLPKPFTNATLLNTLREVLAKSPGPCQAVLHLDSNSS